jgi:hypothetical protein
MRIKDQYNLKLCVYDYYLFQGIMKEKAKK